MAKKPRILYVTANGSCRGQMAEGFTRFMAGSMVEVETANLQEGATHPYCQWAMNEAGIDISILSPEPFASKDLNSYTHIVNLAQEANPELNNLPKTVQVDHWSLPDPASVRARPLELIKVFRAVRNEIEKQVKKLLERALSEEA